MKRKNLTLILLIIFFIGLSILLYPSISQYINSKVQSKAITDYDKMLSQLNKKDYSELFEKADNYNKELFKLEFPLVQYKQLTDYKDTINVNNNGMMGYISIDKIKVELPIYHGISNSVLNVAVGHIEGSSLPVGGISTHSVLSAHRGLPSAKLFTNLNKLEIGDTFEITILDRLLTYQVDKITVVDPENVMDLEISEGKDYVTLVTCTPYGINTHRLLVRGTRIENIDKKEIVVTSEAYLIDKELIAIVISIPILLILIIYITIKPAKKSFQKEDIIWKKIYLIL